MNKPVLIGMNNPYGSDPKYALYPYPEHSAGGRLHAMFRTAWLGANGSDCEPTKQKYIDGFDRRNVLASARWDTSLARRQGAELVANLSPGARVVVLGRKTADALGLPKTDWFNPAVRTDGLEREVLFTWWTLPHPSGLCQEYNDPAVRRRVGELLLALFEGREP